MPVVRAALSLRGWNANSVVPEEKARASNEIDTTPDLEDHQALPSNEQVGKAPVPAEIRVTVAGEPDIVLARQKGRELAIEAGFSKTDQTLIATAISEVARNIVVYARAGEITVTLVAKGARRGIRVIACDQGPGIRDIALAMRDGYSTANSLGLGLPGAKRLMDDFEIESQPGQGTTITMAKWVR